MASRYGQMPLKIFLVKFCISPALSFELFFYERKDLILYRHRIFSILFTGLFLMFSQTEADTQTGPVHWDRISKMKPALKVMVLITAERPISLQDLSLLASRGMVPPDRDPAMVLGLRQAIFAVKLKNWMSKPLPPHLQGKVLDHFFMTGLFRVGFRVEKEGYLGPLSLEIAGPRDGFGKQLIVSDFSVRPQGRKRFRVDDGGNRWAGVDYTEIRYGEIIQFQFAFKYRIAMAPLLEHDLRLVTHWEEGPYPQEIQPFLKPGYKIDPTLPGAAEWANAGMAGPIGNVGLEYQRLSNFIKQTIAYDNDKKSKYFGGLMVYSTMDEMYQEVSATLMRKVGACPDTSLLECAFLRARGIPCRTAGRFGHFFTHLFVPGRGWMSTSVHPTGIPLIIDPGSDHVPYQQWRPAIPLKTVFFNSKIRIEAKED